MSKVWFITGSSRGFGRLWAEAALARGDRVAATARDVSQLKGLAEEYPETALVVPLDVTDRSAVDGAIATAYDHFGRLDVVVNNAGFGLRGAVEEVSETDARAVIETNFFGSLWVIQAALPLMREQGSGHLISVTSQAGLIGEPTLALYNASKWALEGMTDALSQEVEGFGIKVSLVEPGPYTTEFGSDASLRQSRELAVYDDARKRLMAGFDLGDLGNPDATVDVLFKLVDADEPPLRLIMGKAVFGNVRRHYEARLRTWEAWADDAVAAHGVR